MRRKVKNDRFDIYEGDTVKWIEPEYGRVYDAKVLKIGDEGVKVMVFEWDGGQKQGEVTNRSGRKLVGYNEIIVVGHGELEPDPMRVIKRIMNE